jgi:DNA-binding HxlR family transcriptional regulator
MHMPQPSPSTQLKAALERGPFSPSFHAASELIGRRWNGAILYSLFHGLNRFSDLENAIPRLKELEAAGILKRTVIPETPVRVEYSLTEKGEALRPIFIAVNHWANQWHTD